MVCHALGLLPMNTCGTLQGLGTKGFMNCAGHLGGQRSGSRAHRLAVHCAGRLEGSPAQAAQSAAVLTALFWLGGHLALDVALQRRLAVEQELAGSLLAALSVAGSDLAGAEELQLNALACLTNLTCKAEAGNLVGCRLQALSPANASRNLRICDLVETESRNVAVQVLQLPAAEVVPYLEEGVLSINEEVIAEAARALNNFCQVAEVMAYTPGVPLLCHCHACHVRFPLTALALPGMLSAAIVPASHAG